MTTAIDLAKVQRRTLAVVIASQVLGGAGLSAGVAVGALLARDMLGSDALSGLPAAVFTLGSAAAAFGVGRIAQRSGRRISLAIGFGAGALGAVGIVIAAAIGNIPLLFAALLVYGSGTATNLQARYAGTDLAAPDRRGRAISVSLAATTLGAVAGPNLLTPTGAFAEAIGLPRLSGPFLLAAVAYGAAGLIFYLLLRPDPFLLARDVAARAADDDAVEVEAGGASAPRSALYIGAAVMVTAQIVMTGVMTMTPVHMVDLEYGLTAVGVIIGAHVAAMFLPSLVTGPLVDRVGRGPMALGSVVLLVLAGLLAAWAPMDSLGLLAVALILLGLGWNLGLISGTALVVDATSAPERPTVQGSIDVLIALAGAGAGALAGVVMSVFGFDVVGYVGAVIAVLLLPVLWMLRRAGAFGRVAV
ncbi:MFS transporter [Gordonia alkaliphila]|uniref:MFS transporter n=1 Tax=Gordonia alkaliphila TaxID=1053547 RepID=UPI001FF10331|nr:MFS transporter [Gordonia alkaliphila]MCK0438030.1 MFS transporter [Gordonia alkaliphila]